MSIPLSLLTLTNRKALGTVGYGGAGLWKSYVKHTLPGPILDFDFEGGNVSLLPWLRRQRKWNEKEWNVVSQQEREAAYSMIPSDKQGTSIRPQGLIDTIWYDNMDRASYFQFVGDLGSFETSMYNSLCLDSLMEFSFDVKTASKAAGKETDAFTPGGTPWDQIQERTAIQLRRLSNYRDQGIFIYLIGQELIDKDYVKDPRSKEKGEAAPEAYSVKGTVDVPGKMVNSVQHVTDLMFHCRTMNNAPVWVTRPEPLPGGGANWEAKDRTGRIKEMFIRPNFRTIFKDIYGEEGMSAIYTAAKELLSRG